MTIRTTLSTTAGKDYNQVLKDDWLVDVYGKQVTAKKYVAPLSTQGNDTVLLQNFIDEMSAAAVAEKKIRKIFLPEDQVYLVDGLTHRPYLDIDGQGSTLRKVAGYSGNFFTSPTFSVIRTPMVQTNGSFYGYSKHLALRNIILDCNNQNATATAYYLNVEHLEMENVTAIVGPWTLGWTFVIGGKNIQITNPKIFGPVRVFQDGCHIMFGENIHISGGYIESGDDGIAFGDDQITSAGVYYDDQGLSNFSAIGTSLMSTRGSGVKVYRPAVAPFASAPNNYTKTAKVAGGKISVIGRTGILRNGGVAIINHCSPDNRVQSDLRDIHIHADLEVGYDGKGVYAAVAGTLVGYPTAVSKASSAQVALAGHGLTTGEVVTFVDIPSNGMQNLVGFYQVRNPATDTFELSDNAFRSTIGLNSTSFTTWNSGTLVKCRTGSGYKVGEDLTLAGGTFIEPAVFRIMQVDENGAVRAVRRISQGSYSTLPSSPNTPTGGSGSGAQLFLDTVHYGVNAFGAAITGAQDCSISGKMNINDTTGSATRFNSGYFVDCLNCTYAVDIPKMPGQGGVWLINESGTQKSRYNTVNAHLTGDSNISTSAGYVLMHNSVDTTISGVFDEIPSNISAVRSIINGNVIESKNIVSISADDPAVFQVTGHGRKVGDPVMIAGNVVTQKNIVSISDDDPSVFQVTGHGRKVGDLVIITGNVLSAGSISNIVYQVRSVVDANNITLQALNGSTVKLSGATVTTLGTIAQTFNNVLFRVRSVIDANNITLQSLDGDSFRLGGDTISTPGTIALAANSATVYNLTLRKATGATGTAAFNNASNTPHRASALTVRDCDVLGVDNVFTSSVTNIPILSVSNVNGYTVPSRVYRALTVTHDMLVSDTMEVIIPDAAVTINAPTNLRKGQKLNVYIKQGATTYAVTWNPIFKKVADGTAIAHSTGVTRFEYDGTSFVQIGGALTYY